MKRSVYKNMIAVLLLISCMLLIDCTSKSDLSALLRRAAVFYQGFDTSGLQKLW